MILSSTYQQVVHRYPHRKLQQRPVTYSLHQVTLIAHIHLSTHATIEQEFIEMAEQPLIGAISTYDLHICADGAFLKEYGQGSHAWVFSDGGH